MRVERRAICIIANPCAGSWPGEEAFEELLAEVPGSRIVFTEEPGHAARLAREAADGGCGTVVAAGGDGTINEIVTGLAHGGHDTALGLLPLGTGNDLARTLCVPQRLPEALDVLRADDRRRLDLIRMRCSDGMDRYGVNASVGGPASEMTSELDPAVKRTLGPLAFVGAALRLVGQLEPYRVHLTWDDHVDEDHEAVAIVVGNGRTAGGGRRTAPHANPEDGLLDVVVVRPGDALDYADIAARLLAGDYTQHPNVLVRCVRTLEVRAEPPMAFNLDGELVARTPVRFDIVPGALQVVVGPGYSELPPV